MTSTSSKSLPFIVLGIVFTLFVAEAWYDIDIDVEQFTPVLVAIGVGGAAKAAVEKAGAVRKAIPDNIKQIIRDEVDGVIGKRAPA